MKAFDNNSGKEVDIPSEQLPDAIVQGNISLPKGTKLKVFDPMENSRTEIDPRDAYKYFSAGFKYVSPEQEREEALNQEYANRPVAAAGLGLARGLSFGLSDQVLNEFIGEDELREIEERNAVASGVGEVASLFVPLGEASALIKGTSKVGGAVSRAVAKGLGANVGDKILVKALKKAAEYGAGSAAEGAIYGAGHFISEEALGRADLTAENVIASIGTGAIIGGALGGALGASKEFGAAGINKARDSLARAYNRRFPKATDPFEALGSLRNKLDFVFAPAEQKSLVLEGNLQGSLKRSIIDVEEGINNTMKLVEKSKIPSQILKDSQFYGLSKEVKIAHQKLKRALVEEVEFGYLAKKNITPVEGWKVASVAEKAKSKRFIDIDEEEFTKILNSSAAEKGSLANLAKDYYSSSERLISVADDAYAMSKIKGIDTTSLKSLMGKNKENFTTYLEAQKLKNYLEGVQEYISAGNQITPEMVERINQQYGKAVQPELAFIKGSDLFKGENIGLARDLQTRLKPHVYNLNKPYQRSSRNVPMSQQLGGQEGFFIGSMLNGLSSVLKTAIGVGYAGFRAGQFVQHNPVYVAKHILALERSTEKMRNFISTTAKKFVEEDLRKISGKVVPMTFDFQLKTKPGKNETQEQGFERVVADLDNIMDSGEIYSRLANWGGALGNVAPNTTEEIAKKTMASLEYIYNEIPRTNHDAMTSNIKVKPSRTEIRQFARKVNLVFKPAETLEHLLSGKLSNDEIQIVKNTNPGLMEQVKERISNEIKDKPLSYQKRLLLSQIFDVPFAVGMDSAFIAEFQKGFAEDEETKKETKKSQMESASYETSGQKTIG